MFEQSYSFSFEAAHELGMNVQEVPDHPYSYLHGHSFEVTVYLSAQNLGEKGWVVDFSKVKAACNAIHKRLDHRFLNHIEGLDRPTLEHIARYIFLAMQPEVPVLSAVEVGRPSLREKVRYSAPHKS